MSALAHKPVGMIVGGVPFVRPDARVRMTRASWHMLGQAVLLKDAGIEHGALAAIARLEERLGVHPAHRRALIHGSEVVTSEISRKAVVRQWEERQRAEALQTPLQPVTPPQTVHEKMAEARRHELAAKTLRGANPRRNSAEVRKAIKAHEAAAVTARREAQRMMESAKNESWSRSAIKESEALAKDRGVKVAEEVVQTVEWLRDENGALVRDKSSQVGILRTERAVVRRMVSHNGLAEAYERGDLANGQERLVSDHRLFAVGQRYRSLFVQAENLLTPEKAGTGGGFGPKGLQEHQVTARELLAQLRDGLPQKDMRGERLSIRTHPLHIKTRKVLDLVAGEDQTVGHTAKALKMDERTVKKHLRRGLFHCGENLGWW